MKEDKQLYSDIKQQLKFESINIMCNNVKLTIKLHLI